MPFFSYVCIDGDGKTVTGSLEAPTAQAARATLRQMDLSIQSIQSDEGQSTASPTETSSTAVTQKEQIVSWTDVPTNASAFAEASSKETGDVPVQKYVRRSYYPLIDTFRLYAGWLLVWYGFIYALGSYQFTRNLPVRFSVIDGLFLSPLVLYFSLTAFLFLGLTTIHKLWGRGVWKGLAVTIVGCITFLSFVRNT